jgi:hypothetical protein
MYFNLLIIDVKGQCWGYRPSKMVQLPFQIKHLLLLAFLVNL